MSFIHPVYIAVTVNRERLGRSARTYRLQQHCGTPVHTIVLYSSARQGQVLNKSNQNITNMKFKYVFYNVERLRLLKLLIKFYLIENKKKIIIFV